MKKAYEKPGMYVENFSLTQSIAAACGAHHNSTLGRPTHGDIGDCGWYLDKFTTYWTEGTQVCTDDPGDSFMTDTDGIVCYNAPNGGQTVFAS